jgi:hypothetical protein
MPEVAGKRIFFTPISFGRPLDAGVNVLGVLAEDHHVDLLGPFDRRGHALEVAHRAQADIQIQHLANGHVQRGHAATDGRGERALDADQVGLEGLQGLGRQPAVEELLGLFAGVDLGPGDLLSAREFLFHRGVEHAHRGAPDVRTRAVAFDKGQDGVIGHLQVALAVHGDGLAARGNDRLRGSDGGHGPGFTAIHARTSTDARQKDGD